MPPAPIALPREDWFRATWRETPPLRLPRSPAFEAASALQRLALAPECRWQGHWSWSHCKIPLRPSEAEGRFWLRAIARMGEVNEAEMAVASLKARADDPNTREEASALLARAGHRLPVETWSALLGLFTPVESATLLVVWDRATRHGLNSWHLYGMGESCLSLNRGFQQRVLPYLTEADRDAIRELLQPLISTKSWPAQGTNAPHLPLLLAASIGKSPTVARIVESWPDRATAGAPPLHPQAVELILGLDSLEEVKRHAERLRLRLEAPADARAWLAHTGLDGLDLLLQSVLAQKRKPGAEALARVMALADAPTAAPYLLQVMLKSPAAAVGRAWLEKHPAHAAAGLLETAQGRGQAAEAAREMLQTLRRAGHGAAIEQALDAGGEGAAKLKAGLDQPGTGSETVLDDASAPGWLRAATAKPLLPPRPSWLPPGELPPLTLNGLALSPGQEEAILSALQRSTLKEPRSPLAELKREADRHALDAFLWRLCTLWQQRGRKVKESWALEAMGLLGGDAAALKLGPLAKEWREKLQHRPAALAIDCLAAIGTDTALAQLRNFTRIPRDWSLKETADSYIKAAAQARGLTEEELEDRLVPDCGLGTGRARGFDFGARRFDLALGEGLKPMLRGSDGALRGDLPKPSAQDNLQLAMSAAADWKLLKKQLAEVLRRQARRLEQAMVHGRRWSADEFASVFLRQPVMTLLAQSLIWRAHAAPGGPASLFRVAEDHSLADAADVGFQLAADAEVSIPHPLSLSEQELGLWGEKLADYGLIPPFPQIGRAVHTPTSNEAAADCLQRFNHLPCLAIALSEGLERQGWRRYGVGDGGCFYAHLREFPAAGITAVVQYEPGIFVSSPRESAEQRLSGCRLYHGDPQDGKRLRLGEVDPMVFSETVESLWTAVGRR